MNRYKKNIISDLQNINHVIDIIYGLTNEKPTEALLGQIKANVKQIKKITKEYENE